MDQSGQKRNVIPRWRSIDRTPAVELESASKHEPVITRPELLSRLQFQYEKWRAEPDLALATEVVDSAVLIDEPFLAVGPARAILNDPSSMPAIREVARFVIDGRKIVSPNVELEGGLLPAYEKESSIFRIRNIKKRLVDEPRNTLLWLEKGRLQTQIGDTSGAYRSLQTALATAAESREVLRAYARFMAHIGRAEDGHKRLIKAERLSFDPWIQSAEIALAQAAERTPRSVGMARTLLQDRRVPPQHLSELAAAIATLEANEGATARARKLLKQSLELPTDNSLSQAYWIRQSFGVHFPIAPVNLKIPAAFEARVQAAVTAKNWKVAVDNSKRWIRDEPFSLRAAIEGSFIATSYSWSPADAWAICEYGMIANPNDSSLLNNAAVALVRMGELERAEQFVEKMVSACTEEEMLPYVPATQGLLHFARGRFAEGRTLYEEAIAIARRLRDPEVQFRALSHWAFEELSAGELYGEAAEKVVARLDKLTIRIGQNSPGAEAWSIMKQRALGTEKPREEPSPDLLSLFSNVDLVDHDLSETTAALTVRT